VSFIQLRFELAKFGASVLYRDALLFFLEFGAPRSRA
jgi:hypothetical protein